MTKCLLSAAPTEYRNAASFLADRPGLTAELEVWPAHRGHAPVLVAVLEDFVLVASPEGATELPVADLSFSVSGRSVSLVSDSAQISVDLAFDKRDVSPFVDELMTARRALLANVQRPTKVTAASQILIVTMNNIPGFEVTDVFGDVFGLTVRARNAFSNVGASLRTVTGGEVGGYTKLLHASRMEARERMAAAALERGANAIIAMRFDCNEIGDIMTEVAAYGTAVTIRRVGA